MDMAWISHPKLTDGGAVQVPESAVPHHQRSGWDRADAPTEPPTPVEVFVGEGDGEVRIRHPELDGRVVSVPASAVPHHQRAGWEIADPPPPDPEPDQHDNEAPAGAGASALQPDESPKRRRATTRGDE